MKSFVKVVVIWVEDFAAIVRLLVRAPKASSILEDTWPSRQRRRNNVDISRDVYEGFLRSTLAIEGWYDAYLLILSRRRYQLAGLLDFASQAQ